MAYNKAKQLLQIAMEIAATHYGMSYAQLDEYSEAPSETARRRNTQRLVAKLEELLGDQVIIETNDENRKIVKIRTDGIRDLVAIKPDELSALDRAIEALEANGGSMDAQGLKDLRTKIRIRSEKKGRSKLEVDYDALVSSGHVIARHGPSPKIESDVWEPVTQAILELRQVSFDYPSKDGTTRRTAHPYGVITGYRAYLVALSVTSTGTNPSRWRLDRMSNVQVTTEAAIKPDDFDLVSFARRGFGAYNNDEEYGEVEWRFAPEVADNVRGFRFHPDQEITEEKDGSVTVRFSASGYVEMAWALYPWGDKVTVNKPERVRSMIAGYQRSDWPAYP